MKGWTGVRKAAAVAAAALLLASAGCTSPPRTEPALAPELPSQPPAPVVVETVPMPKRTAPPAPPPVQPEAQPPALSYSVRRMLSQPPRVAGRLDVPIRRKWKYIIIHHSQTAQGSEAVFDRYHKEQRRWKGIGYDFVIGNGHGSADGLVEATFRWEQQITGAHAASKGNVYNQEGIGICLVGDLEKDYPTARQMEALVGLVNYLQNRCRIPTANILGHNQVPGASTKCPGHNFPWYEFYSLIDH
jgi:N-acetylmuramoyl-L-alanine amidase